MSSPFAHGSIALIAKRQYPKIPFGVLLLSTQFPDLLFYVFQFLGIETKAETTQDIHNGIQYISPAFIPWSHGLSMCLAWSLLIAAITFLFRKKLLESAVVGVMVLSHWMLDAIMYSNLPLFFDHSVQIGFGLATFGTGFIIGIVIEAVLVVGSIAYFLCTRKKKER